MSAKTAPDTIKKEVLKIIKSHIGKPCPTNTTIARMMGRGNRNVVSMAISELCKEGVLARSGSQHKRVLIFPETGRGTLPGECTLPRRETNCHYPDRPIVAPEMPAGVCFDDVRPEDLDARGRAYLAFDASLSWPRHWPRKPVAAKSDHVPERLRSISAHAS